MNYGRCVTVQQSAAAIALVAALVLQFGVFYRDFFTHYPLRSAFYYDPGGFRGCGANT